MLERKIRAEVVEIFYKTSSKPPRKIDILLKNIDSSKLTKKGDSGTIWKDSTGRAVAMHIRGDVQTNSLSYSTFINRITKNLDIRLLEIKG